ncbi:MAG: DNA mismatch repair endonuclease MutH [Myxococcales bacterium]|nr:DNA mismatch repair endonuclease MutH [Myxococcales bacterium]
MSGADPAVAPADEPALCRRARGLSGRTIAEVARELGRALPHAPGRAKGYVGTLVEAALGASAGNRSEPDFPALGVELKTVPMSAAGVPRESTFVCSIALDRVADAEWAESAVARKLERVLFIPVESERGVAFEARRFGAPLLWSPAPAQRARLRADWEMLADLVGRGELDRVTAHLGVALQIRPKAAHSRVVRLGPGEDGSVWTLPRGFYLRRTFTASVFATAAGGASGMGR